MALVSVRPSDMIKEESFGFGKSARGEERGGGQLTQMRVIISSQVSIQHPATSATAMSRKAET